MKKIIQTLKILFVLFPVHSFSQGNFEIAIGGPGEETCAQVLADVSQFVLIGHSTSSGAGSYDICLVRTDIQGNVLGNTLVGSFGEDLALSGSKTDNHQYIATGYTNSFGSDRPFAVKFDSSGNLLWSKYYSIQGWGEGIASLENGDFYITGYSGAGDIDVLLMKCDDSGNVIWAKTFGDTLINEGRSISITADGSAIVTGITHRQPGGPTDIFVTKVDSSGRMLWSNRYATPDFLNWDLGYSVKSSGDNILIGCLSYNQAFNSNPNSPDGLILILDANGNIKNAFAFGTSEYEDIRDLAFMNNGKICLTGVSNYQSQGQTDFLFTIADTLGNIYTQKYFGGSTYDHGLSVIALDDENFLLGGYTQSFGHGTNDMYFIKTDTSITPGCHEITGNIQVAPVTISVFSVFDTATILCSGFNANYSVSHQSLPVSILCSTTNTEESPENFIYSISPNPFYDNFIIRMKNSTCKKINLQLYDVAGRLVLNESESSNSFIHNRLIVSTNTLSSGLYTCVILFDQRKYQCKLIKN